jgi:arylsulfatase A-like enzyme
VTRAVQKGLALALALMPLPAAGAPPAARPNIVLLVADDWGYSDIGSFGSEIHTPNIDALAAHGVRFANFHVAGSCAPTRAMLQTGISNHRAGLGNMPETIPLEHVGKPGYDTVLNHHVVTLAEVLHQAGYRTYLTGKWHLGKASDGLPTARGYDHAYSLADAGADNFEQKPIAGLYDKADWTEDGKPATLPTPFYSSTFIVDTMMRYIDAGRGSGKPFFASVNFLANHIPVQAPDAYIARYAHAYDGGWRALRAARQARAIAMGLVPPETRAAVMRSTADWNRLSPDQRRAAARAMAAYGGMAEAADHEIGRLIDHLKATGAYDNTIFVFLSDNGPEPTDPRGRLFNRLVLGLLRDFTPEHQGERGTLTAIGPNWASAAAAPLAGYKFSAGEGGLRVPLIVSWPGNPAMRSGTIVGGFTHVTDIAPTLLALAGVPAQTGHFAGRAVEPMVGFSLADMLLGRRTHVHGDTPLGYELSGNAALFRGDYKLVKNLPPLGDGRWQLFDITHDPGETHDLSKEQPARFIGMRRDYAAFAQRDQVLPMPAGYTADQQISDNAFRYWLPRVLPAMLGGAAALLAGGIVLWRRRRRATAKAR